MAELDIALLHRVLATAFPFSFVFDASMRLVSAGTSLQRACPRAVPPCAVEELGRLSTPAIPMSFDAIAAHPEALAMFVLTDVQGGELPMRGQFVVDRDAALGFFLGSPWVDDAQALVSAGLSVEDFAVHDSVLDRLFAARARALARADAGRMDDLLRAAERTRQQLASAEQALARELDAVPDLLLRMTGDGTLLTVRPSAAGDLARPAEEYLGLSVDSAFPELADGLRAAFAGAADQDVVTFEFDETRELVVRHFEARVARTSAGELLALVRDVTEQRVLAGQLAHQAWHDPLTGLANRALFTHKVTQTLVSRTDDQRGGCVLFLDLDDFKQVNDVLGHAAGDSLLVQVAARMREALRPGDLIARLGGDEFAVLLEGVGEEAGRLAAGRLADSLVTTFPAVGDQPALHTSASIGVAAARPSDTVATLLSHADVAMYAAKAAGKGCHRVFEEGMRDQLLARISAEMELRGAIDRGELYLDYQPIVELGSAEVVGLEALVRWQHPSRGTVMPCDFIPVAESSGVIIALGAWVLRAACAAAICWTCRTDGRERGISVNVSARQIEDGRFVDVVRQALTESGLAPTRLTLEVTETALVGSSDLALENLEAIRALGVRLSLDDFGTGFSSLSHLRRFTVDEIKIDKSFVDEIDDPRQARIAEGILALSAVLGVCVVAEGVETREQSLALAGIGCTHVQGYFFGRPGSDQLVRAYAPAEVG